MARRGKEERDGLRVQEGIGPNLIPMVDIMFLLLLFPMLGSDMGRRQLEEVFLPRADAVDDGERLPPGGQTIVNVHHRVLSTCRSEKLTKLEFAAPRVAEDGRND